MSAHTTRELTTEDARCLSPGMSISMSQYFSCIWRLCSFQLSLAKFFKQLLLYSALSFTKYNFIIITRFVETRKYGTFINTAVMCEYASYSVVKVVLWSRGAHLTKPGWSKPHTHSNPINLALFRRKITLYRFNQGGSYYCRGLKWEQGAGPPGPPHFNHWSYSLRYCDKLQSQVSKHGEILKLMHAFWGKDLQHMLYQKLSISVHIFPVTEDYDRRHLLKHGVLESHWEFRLRRCTERDATTSARTYYRSGLTAMSWGAFRFLSTIAFHGKTRKANGTTPITLYCPSVQ